MRFLKSPIGFILSTTFLNFAGLTIIIPVIPYIVQEFTNQVALFVGLITAVASLCQFLSAPALGYVSDRIGRRPVILLSLLGGVAGYVVFGIGGALWVLFLGRIIDGLSGGDTTAMYAWVADTYESRQRSRYYGLIGAAAAFGFMVGPAIGGFVGELNLAAPLFTAAAISLINAVWGYFVLPESLAKENRVAEFKLKHLNPFAQFRAAMSTFTLRVLFVASFVFFTGLIMQQSNFSVFLVDVLHWGPTNIGIVLTLVGLVDFAAEGYLTGAFTPIFGELRVLNVGIVLTAIGMIMVGVVGFTASAELLYLAVVVFMLGDGLFEPAMTGLIANATPAHMQGRVQGANQAIQAMARVVAPVVAGLLYDETPSMPYFASAIIIAGALLIVLSFRTSLAFVQSDQKK